MYILCGQLFYMDSGWRSKDDDAVDLDLSKINNLEENDLRKLASRIGINFHNPQPKKRSRRQRKKTKKYVPAEQLRDWRDAKQKKMCKNAQTKKTKVIADKNSVTRRSVVKSGGNAFGGVNAKKQRAIFSSRFTTSVHRPLDVYKGMCVCACDYVFVCECLLVDLCLYNPLNLALGIHQPEGSVSRILGSRVRKDIHEMSDRYRRMVVEVVKPGGFSSLTFTYEICSRLRLLCSIVDFVTSFHNETSRFIISPCES